MDKNETRLLWALVVLFVVIAIISFVLSFLFRNGSYTGTYGPFGMMGSGYYGMGTIMPIVGAISVVLVLVFVYFLADALRGEPRAEQSSSGRSPEAIAKERLARGEITEDEYNGLIQRLKE